MQAGLTVDQVGLLAGAVKRGEKDRNENRDDSDDHQQFDEREGGSGRMVYSIERLWSRITRIDLVHA